MTLTHVSCGGILIQVQDEADLAVARRDFLAYLASWNSIAKSRSPGRPRPPLSPAVESRTA